MSEIDAVFGGEVHGEFLAIPLPLGVGHFHGEFVLGDPLANLPAHVFFGLAEFVPFYDTLQVDVDVTGVSSGLTTTLTVFMVHRPLDINGDGRTNISDATAFGAEFNGGMDPNLIDENCDGTVNISDATAFGARWNLDAANAGPLPAKP